MRVTSRSLRMRLPTRCIVLQLGLCGAAAGHEHPDANDEPSDEPDATSHRSAVVAAPVARPPYAWDEVQPQACNKPDDDWLNAAPRATPSPRQAASSQRGARWHGEGCERDKEDDHEVEQGPGAGAGHGARAERGGRPQRRVPHRLGTVQLAA